MTLQEKMNEIASTFGATTGVKASKRCRGKWRGTVDYSIMFDNGEQLFIGNSSSRRKFSDFVGDAYELYNPLTVHMTKEFALEQLRLRSSQDNAIAEKMGFLPYEVVSVEFIKSEKDGYIGWYYIVLKIDGELTTHLESGLDYDIRKQKFSEKVKNYYTAGALKDEEVDYIFCGVGFSTKSTIYKPKKRVTFNETEYTKEGK